MMLCKSETNLKMPVSTLKLPFLIATSIGCAGCVGCVGCAGDDDDGGEVAVRRMKG